MTTVEFATMRGANAPNPTLINNLPVIIHSLYLSIAMLVHQMYHDAFSSFVCHIGGVGGATVDCSVAESVVREVFSESFNPF
jgi:hypothetical protein